MDAVQNRVLTDDQDIQSMRLANTLADDLSLCLLMQKPHGHYILSIISKIVLIILRSSRVFFSNFKTPNVFNLKNLILQPMAKIKDYPFSSVDN